MCRLAREPNSSPWASSTPAERERLAPSGYDKSRARYTYVGLTAEWAEGLEKVAVGAGPGGNHGDMVARKTHSLVEQSSSLVLPHQETCQSRDKSISLETAKRTRRKAARTSSVQPQARLADRRSSSTPPTVAVLPPTKT